MDGQSLEVYSYYSEVICITTAEIVHALGSISGADWVGILLLCLVSMALLEVIDNSNKRKSRNVKKNRE